MADADAKIVHFVKGRGAGSNAPSRFLKQARGADRAGAHHALEDGDEGVPNLKTQVTMREAKSIISRNSSPDLAFDQTINPYQGCEHGCVYCFARPTHAYLELSPGLDFETKIFAKTNAAELLRHELGRRSYKPGLVALGASTDPYQPVERELGITRSILEVLAESNVPVGITTKSATVVRDIDILAPMAAKGLARVHMSVPSLDPRLSRLMDPRANSPARRIDAIRQLSEVGIPVALYCSPIIPVINEAELESIMEAAADAGAKYSLYTLLRLPLEVRDIFVEWLEAHFPDRARHVMSLLNDMRAGKDYDPDFRVRMKGVGAHAEMLAQRHRAAQRRLGLAPPPDDFDLSLFKPPGGTGGQGSLF